MRNSGARAGSTVLQIYIRDRDSSEFRPEKELKAFAKVRLAPGEFRRVEMELTARDFAYFDAEHRQWKVNGGAFDIVAGFSASDLLDRVTVRIDGGPIG